VRHKLNQNYDASLTENKT